MSSVESIIGHMRSPAQSPAEPRLDILAGLAELRGVLDALPNSREELERIVAEARSLVAGLESMLATKTEQLEESVATAVRQVLAQNTQVIERAERILSETAEGEAERSAAVDRLVAEAQGDIDRRLNEAVSEVAELARSIESQPPSDGGAEVLAQRVEQMVARLEEERRRVDEAIADFKKNVEWRIQGIPRQSPPRPTKIYKSGTLVGERPGVNFIAGSNVTLTIEDNGQDRVNVTIASSGGPGGSGHTIREGGADLTARTGLHFTTGLTATDDAAGDETEVAIDTSVVYTVGGTDVPVTDGGTGASTAAGARTNLGVPADADVVHDTGDETIAGVKTFSSDPLIPDEAYDATNWNGVLEPPTKNAVRDKIEDILDGVTFTGDVVVPDEAYNATNWNASLEVPTKNAVRDAIEGLSASYVAKATVPEVIVIAVSDETTAITTGTAKVTFRMPFAMTLTAARASLSTASSSGNPTFDVNEAGSSIFGANKLSIDANEKTSTTAATAVDLSDTALADDAELTIDIDTAGTGAKGAKVYLIGTRAV